MKILVLCPFPYGVAAGQRLKFEQYYNDWCLSGHNIQVRPFMSMSLWQIAYKKGFYFEKIILTFLAYIRRFVDLAEIPNYDLVYVFMWVSPFGPPFFERLARALAKKILYDLEDNLLASSNDQYVSSVNPLLRLIKSSSKIKYLIQQSDAVITSSPDLEQQCAKLNKNSSAKYITSSVNVSRFRPSSSEFYSKVCIGWTGTISSLPYLRLLEPVLFKLSKIREFKLLVIGNFDYSFDDLDLDVLQWNKQSEIADLGRIDIGLYPLPSTDWVGGKSGLKAIQYMAMQIPVVASNVGNTPNVVVDNSTGLLVNSQDEWLRALISLIDNPSLRALLGANGRRRCEKLYSTQVVSSLYVNALDNAISD